MNKKIDFFNKNNKKIDNTKKNQTMRNDKHPTGSIGSNGSKTAKVTKTTKTQNHPTDQIVKRRGRRPKKILEDVITNSDNSAENTSNQKNDSAVILRLNINPSKLGIKNSVDPKEKTKPQVQSPKMNDNLDYQNLDDNNSSEGMFKNDIPDDNRCHKCAKNEKDIAVLKNKLEKYEKKDKTDKTNKIFSNKINFITYTTGKKMVLKKTNIKCWWDAHSFTGLPCVLPELYHNGVYHVTGCFCSFNCALAHNLYYIKDSKIHQRKTLIYQLYREMYQLNSDEIIDIKEAPPKEILEDFGGDMSIDVFRRSFVMTNKEYIIYMPPIKPINLTIEERNIETVDDDNDKEYILKRSKPLTKKKSIISSMKMKMDDGDDD